MKTILVIADNSHGQPIVETFRTWQEQYSIVVTEDENKAQLLLKDKVADLIICDMASRPSTPVRDLQQLTYSFPYIPCIAIINSEAHSAEDILRLGVSSCLEAPFRSEELQRWTNELLYVAVSGTIKGLPIHSLLQMLEGEGKTCTLKVSECEAVGFIYMVEGTVVAAETVDQKNEDAVYTIIGWDNIAAEIRFFNRQREVLITKSLMSLIMEAFRLKDERKSLTAEQRSCKKAGMDLKHFSTLGKNLSLEKGTKIELELGNNGEPLLCSLVGMIPEKYFIVSKPGNFHQIHTADYIKTRIVAKYQLMGRLCMFRTEVKYALQKPEGLLFIEYPRVIHYRELRRAKRMFSFIPSTFGLPDGIRFNSLVIDLSSMGCLCQIRAINNDNKLPSLDIGNRISLFCLFPGVKEEINLMGIVRNINRRQNELKAGIEFVELESHSRETIFSYLRSLGHIFNPWRAEQRRMFACNKKNTPEGLKQTQA